MEYVIFLGQKIMKIFEHMDLIIPTALTIYGWRLIYIEGNRLAKRNETFNLFQMIRKILEETNKEAEKIWLASGSSLSELDDATLVAHCAEFELCINQIKKNYCDVSISTREILNLRRALTCSPYPLDGQLASNQKRIKVIKALVSELSFTLFTSTYESINSATSKSNKK